MFEYINLYNLSEKKFQNKFYFPLGIEVRTRLSIKRSCRRQRQAIEAQGSVSGKTTNKIMLA